SVDNVNTKIMDANLKEEISRLQAMGDEDITGADGTIATLEEKLDQFQKSIDNFVVPFPSCPSLHHTRQNLRQNRTFRGFELKEHVAKLQYQKQLLVCQ
ncbi:hypothetical protein KI387_020540, partial [Taxus chinensis]